VAVGDVAGLPPGSIISARGLPLRRLRADDVRLVLAAATAVALARRAATLVLSAIFWRNT
jgi:hypothetical protein